MRSDSLSVEDPSGEADGKRQRSHDGGGRGSSQNSSGTVIHGRIRGPAADHLLSFAEPAQHWLLQEGAEPQLVPGRRAAHYYYRAPGQEAGAEEGAAAGEKIDLPLVNLVRGRVSQWRSEGWPGVTGTTLELLEYWRRDGREKRLLFAQLEAAEAIIFLTEARRDFLQGIAVPLDEPSDAQKAEGIKAFQRYACKMATGSGKTTVMGMLAAWSILNNVHRHANATYSDVVLVVCPNVTIRSRLGELDPKHGEASLDRTRDLVPPHLMPDLAKGRVLVTNWHVFEPQSMQAGGVSAKVMKAGVRKRVLEYINIAAKSTTARGKRDLTREEFDLQVANGLLEVKDEELDCTGGAVREFLDALPLTTTI